MFRSAFPYVVGDRRGRGDCRRPRPDRLTVGRADRAGSTEIRVGISRSWRTRSTCIGSGKGASGVARCARHVPGASFRSTMDPVDAAAVLVPGDRRLPLRVVRELRSAGHRAETTAIASGPTARAGSASSWTRRSSASTDAVKESQWDLFQSPPDMSRPSIRNRSSTCSASGTRCIERPRSRCRTCRRGSGAASTSSSTAALFVSLRGTGITSTRTRCRTGSAALGDRLRYRGGRRWCRRGLAAAIAVAIYNLQFQIV